MMPVWALLLSFSPRVVHADFATADTRRTVAMPVAADALGMGGATTSTFTGMGSDNPATLGVITGSRYLTFSSTGVDYSRAANLRTADIGVSIPVGFGLIDVSMGNAKAARSVTATGEDYSIVRAPYLMVSVAGTVVNSWLSEGDQLLAGVAYSPRYRSTVYRFHDAEGGMLESSYASQGATVGLLYSTAGGSGFGASYGHYRAHHEDRYEGVTDPVTLQYRSTYRVWKAGVSQQLSDRALVSVEYQRFSTDDTLDKVVGGVEYCVSTTWCFYGGHNGGGPTAALGFHKAGRLHASIGYAYRLADGLSRTFGDSGTLTFSLSLVW